MEDADRNILVAKLKWFEYQKNWSDYERTLTLWAKQHTTNANWLDLNSYAWNIFNHCNDKQLLDNALSLSVQSIKSTTIKDSAAIPNLMDTKANILYKLGRTDEAISVQEKAITISHEQKDSLLTEELTKNLRKMKKGEPTWPLSANERK